MPRQRNEDWEQNVRLVWDDGEPHKILAATVNDPNMEVLLAETQGRQTVALHVPQDYVVRPGARMVTIETDDTKMPKDQVPIRFTGRAKGNRPRNLTAKPAAARKAPVSRSDAK